MQWTGRPQADGALGAGDSAPAVGLPLAGSPHATMFGYPDEMRAPAGVRCPGLAAGLLSVLAACGGDGAGTGYVDLTDKSPAEASALAADAICRQTVLCGIPRVSCSGGSDVPTQCSGTIERASHAVCYADAQPDLQQILSCPALNAQQRSELQACVNALATLHCVSQSEVDSWARAEEMDLARPGAPRTPMECMLLQQPIPGCS